ncbi:MAG: methyl-accepting chemotaxis protein [Spirochaetales bacterium]|nr:methyl-accepting chemotaxis protein [Spirochaetales bacterium]
MKPNLKKRSFAIPLISIIMVELILVFTIQAVVVVQLLRGEVKKTQNKDYTFIAQSLADLIDSELKYNESLLLGYVDNFVYEMTSRQWKDKEKWDQFCDITLNNLKNSNPYFRNTFILDREGTIVYCSDKGAVGKNLAGREYFQILTSSSVQAYTTPSPINSTSTGQSILVHAAAIRENNQVKYVIGTTMDIAAYGTEHIINKKLGETGYPYVFSADGTILIHSSEELRFTSSLDISPLFEEIIKDQNPVHSGAYVFNGQEKRVITARIEENGWHAAISMDISESDYSISLVRKVFIVSNATLILLTSLIVSLYIRLVLGGKIKKLENLVATASEGILTERGEIKGRDEMTFMTLGVNDFIDSLSRFLRGLNGSLENLDGTGNDLAANMEETAAALFQIRTNVENSLSQIDKQEESVSTTVSTVEQTARNIQSLESNIERQNRNIDQGSSAVEEMVAQIKNVSLSTDEAERLMATLAHSSQSGADKLGNVSSLIREISQRSQELEKANALISGIAARTNLLAMNAAIEAAHAGDSGKGFAVVADEIRKLAEQSTDQSGQVRQSIDGINSMVSTIVTGAEETTLSFDEIANHISKMNHITGEIKASMEEQVAGGSQVLDSLKDLKSSGQEVQAGSEEMTQGNKIILNAVQELTHISSEVAMAMREIDSGMNEINKAVEAVSELSQENKNSIENVRKEASHYKIS